jgi:hypothetical protein
MYHAENYSDFDATVYFKIILISDKRMYSICVYTYNSSLYPVKSD